MAVVRKFDLESLKANTDRAQAILDAKHGVVKPKAEPVNPQKEAEVVPDEDKQEVEETLEQESAEGTETKAKTPSKRQAKSKE